MGWIILIGAGVFEVLFTTSLRVSDGFTRVWPTRGVNGGLDGQLLSAHARHEGNSAGQRLFRMDLDRHCRDRGDWNPVFGDPISASRIAFLVVVLIGVAGLWLAEN